MQLGASAGHDPQKNAIGLGRILQINKYWAWCSAEHQAKTEVGPPPSPGEPPRPGVLPKAKRWTSHMERLPQRAPRVKAVVNPRRIEDGLAVPVPASRIRGNGTNRE